MADTEWLEQIADELRFRVRDAYPEENAAFVKAALPDPEDWLRLAFVLAIATPANREWSSLTAWARDPKPDPLHVDEIAVERACRGERIPLNRAELTAAIERLNRRGLGSRAIAERLGVSARTVVRRRVERRAS